MEASWFEVWLVKKAIMKFLRGVGILAFSLVVLAPIFHLFHGENVGKIEVLVTLGMYAFVGWLWFWRDRN
ncbi:MAG: hypothetical protein ABJP66_00065 [Hyphomicrobiales bacterium]|uniref:hypothetical protein n=1 Tax=Shimia thalassica TaxID=1715693 RepID=UPI003296AF39